MTILNRLYDVFSSVRLTVALLVYFALSAAVSTLFGWDYFSSLFFIIPVALFVLNLCVCMIGRFLKHLSAGTRHHGPDVLHLGLLVLVVGAILSASGRIEFSLTLAPGEAYQFPSGAILAVSKTRRLENPDGSVKNWETDIVHYHADGSEAAKSLSVNHPATVEGFQVSQLSWGREYRMTGTDVDGSPWMLSSGNALQFRNAEVRVPYPAEGSAEGPVAFIPLESPQGVSLGQLNNGDRFEGTDGSISFDNARIVPASGLLLVRDPGIIPMIPGLILAAIGYALTLVYRLKGKKA